MSKDSKKEREYQRETRLIHGKFHSPHWDYKDHMVPPMSSSAAYRLESAERGAQGFIEFANPEYDRHKEPPILIYDRLEEPSRSMLEDNLAEVEEGDCAVCFTTGMAAISAALGVLLKTGDTLIAHHTLYGCTYSLLTRWLPRYGIKVKMVDLKDPSILEKEIDDTARAVYCETPTNPTLELIDIGAVRRAVDKANAGREPSSRIFVIVDNTFATPYCQRPLVLGADVVCHSLTKNIGGFGTDMGGAWIGPSSLESDVLMYRKDFCAPLSSKSAWPPLVYGLPTLALRTRRQMETAMKVARFLEGHPAVASVRYPGLPSHPQHQLATKQMLDADGVFAPGIMLYFVLKGSPEEARETGRKIMNHIASHALSLTLAVSLGNIRTLIEHPASMTPAPLPVAAQLEAGIDPGGIRISIGLEASQDIMGDLEEAFSMVAG